MTKYDYLWWVIEERKNIPTDFNEKNFNILLTFFINYHYIIDSCWYLLLRDKISSETKTFIIISHHITNSKSFYIDNTN